LYSDNNSEVYRLPRWDSTVFAPTHRVRKRLSSRPVGGGVITVHRNQRGAVLILDLRSGKRTLLPVGMVVEARYAQGHLVLARSDGTLHAVPFDAAKGRVEGGSVQIGEDVSLTGTGLAQFAVAENGTVVYVPQQPRELVLVDRSGRAERVTEVRRNFHNPRLSPDGRRIAVDFSTN
jgi:hypothetical protein